MVRRIPTTGARAVSIFESQVVGDLFGRAADRFVAESPKALAFARQGLPNHALSRMGTNLNLVELRAKLSEEGATLQAASRQTQMASGAIVGSLATTLLVGPALITPEAAHIPNSLFVLVSIGLNIALDGLPAFAGIVCLADGAYRGGIDQVAIGAMLIAPVVSFFMSIFLYPYLVETGVGRDLRRLESFLKDPSNREAFFAAHSEEFRRFLKGV